ncbi:hypothetical protein AYI70_g8994 [Smittium culicis]|uniref:Uncharacterized protein n=1 Tax=Smittium culicis TaxID=133412 RepID=A0A1R1XDE4_9FUNG|nr:hypothetical protein AYI70_g8994 [Smittium culicis]
MTQKASKKIINVKISKKNLRKNAEKFLVLNVQELKKDTVERCIVLNSTLKDHQFTVNKIRQRNDQCRHEIHSIDHHKINLSEIKVK